jgi:hypothetical protein
MLMIISNQRSIHHFNYQSRWLNKITIQCDSVERWEILHIASGALNLYNPFENNLFLVGLGLELKMLFK